MKAEDQHDHPHSDEAVADTNLRASDEEMAKYQESWDNRPIVDKLIGLTPEQSQEAIKNREFNRDVAQVGLSVGGTGAPPLDVINAAGSLARSFDAAVGWSRPQSWKDAGLHGLATGTNLFALIPGPGDTAGITASTAGLVARHGDKGRKVGESILKYGDDFVKGAKDLVSMPKKTFDYMRKSGVSTWDKTKQMLRLGGTGHYWGVPPTGTDLDTGTLPTLWGLMGGDDEDEAEPIKSTYKPRE